jgi:hypothetical protein
MWYRLILSARVVTEKEGEKTIHQAPVQYKHPIFIFDDPRGFVESAEGLGHKRQSFGPGYYTAQSPAVSFGYKHDSKMPVRREIKLPKGTNILHFDKLSLKEKLQITRAAVKELGYSINLAMVPFVKNLQELGNIFGDPYLVKLYPILLKMGYDAVEHDVGRSLLGAAIKSNEERMKSDPEYTDEEGNLLEGKYRKHLKRSKDTNVIIINRAILTMPDLFQRVRFRPDSVSPEDMEKYEDELQTTESEYYKELWDNGTDVKVAPSVALRLIDNGLSFDEIANKVSFDVKSYSFTREQALIEIDSLTQLLDKGYDLRSIFDNFDIARSGYNFDFETRLTVAKKLVKYFGEEILLKIFTPSEFIEHKSKFEMDLKDYLGDIYTSTVENFVKQKEIENKFLSLCYDIDYIQCYKCHALYDDKSQNVCNDCGGQMRLRSYKLKPNLSLQDLSEGLKLEKNINYLLTYGDKDVYYLQTDLSTSPVVKDFYYSIADEINNCSSADELKNIYESYDKYIVNFPENIYKDLLNGMQMKALRFGISLSPQMSNDTEPEQSEQSESKVAYKIRRTKTAGKVKYYYFNGESKPLKEHLQDIFPGANSVDIFYMADRVRKMALNDDDVSRVLYEAAVGHLFPRHEDKR